jgi:hypothetical protein
MSDTAIDVEWEPEEKNCGLVKACSISHLGLS